MSRRARKPSDGLQINVSEEKGVRYLHFGTEWVQGAMRVRKPWALELDYSRHMMAWLLFREPPERLLQIGLGAGSLTKFIHRQMPETAITVVENSATVIGVAHSQFQLPPQDSRLEIVLDDGHQYVAQPRLRGYFPVIQVDVFDKDARGPVLDSLEFYVSCHGALSAGGVMAVNLFGDVPSYSRNFQRIVDAFGGRVLVLPPLAAGNVIVLAFRAPTLSVIKASIEVGNWPALRQAADTIEARFGLKAHGWINGLKTTIEQNLSAGLIGNG